MSDEAMKLLRSQRNSVGVDCIYLFPSPTRRDSERGAPLSDMTLTAVLRRLEVDAVPHGFRSTFRDWCAEQTEYPNEVAEMALAHTVGNKVEAAYRRGDLLDKRKRLMQDWSDYARSNVPKTGGPEHLVPVVAVELTIGHQQGPMSGAGKLN